MFVLLRYVLGYEFRDRKWLVTLGVGMLVAEFVIQILFGDCMDREVTIMRFLIAIVIPAMVFEGRVVILTEIAVMGRLIVLLLGTFSLGLGVIVEKGSIADLNVTMVEVGTLALFASVIMIIAYLVKGKKEVTSFHECMLNWKVMMAFIVVMGLLYYGAGYSGAIDAKRALMLQAYDQVKSGLLGVFAVVVFLLLQGIIMQRGELRRLNELNTRCINEQTKQYQMISRKNEEIRAFRHDHNAHIAAMHALVAENEYEKLASYVESLTVVNSQFKTLSTNNIISDAILNEYSELGKMQGIEFNVQGQFPTESDISEIDLCIILSNGIKNAYEAACKCAGEKSISVEITNKNEFTFINVANTVSEKIPIDIGKLHTSKQDKENHGFGMGNMREAVEKNGGKITWKYENGKVITEVALRNC